MILEFLNKFEFLTRFFHREETRQTAKDRLRLVLVHDRSSVAPEMLEGLKEDMIKVINRYMEIDSEHMELGFERKDGSIAFAANIPIIKVRREPLLEPDTAPRQAPPLPETVTPVPAAADAISEAVTASRPKSGKRKRNYPRKKKASVRRKRVSKSVEEV